MTDGQANQQAQLRAMLQGAQTLRMTSQGMDYVSEARRANADADPPLSERIAAFVMEIVTSVVDLAVEGYRVCGPGVVVLSVGDLAWLDEPPAEVPATYMAERAVREKIPHNQSREEALKRIDAYDPERQVITVVAYPGGVFTSTLTAAYQIARPLAPGRGTEHEDPPA